MLDVPVLRQFLRPTRRAPSSGEIDALAADGRLDDAAAAAAAAVSESPRDLERWHRLGRIEHARSASTVRAEDRPVPEDPDLTQVLDSAPPLGGFASTEALRKIAEALLAENTLLARSLVPLRQQLAFRVNAFETWIKYEQTKYHHRVLSLMMQKHGVGSVPVAPKEMPASLVGGFGMHGRVRIQADYLNAGYPDHCLDVFSDFDLETYGRVWRLEPATTDRDLHCHLGYRLALGAADVAIHAAARERLRQDSSVAVVTAGAPVYEALCRLCGANPTTVRDRPVIVQSSQLESLTFEECQRSAPRFDAAITVRLVEHAGLGMHGEALDPDGDLRVMRLIRRLLEPGGILLAILPTGPDGVVFNAMRVYGEIRLPLLLEGWTVLERQQHHDTLNQGSHDAWSLFVLAAA